MNTDIKTTSMEWKGNSELGTAKFSLGPNRALEIDKITFARAHQMAGHIQLALEEARQEGRDEIRNKLLHALNSK